MGTWTKIWIESFFLSRAHTHTHLWQGRDTKKLFLFSCDQKLYKTMKPFAGCLLENIHLSDSLKDRLGFLFLWRGLKHGFDLFEAMKQWRCPSVLQFCPSGFLLGSLFFGGFQVGGRTWRYTSVSDTPETPSTQRIVTSPSLQPSASLPPRSPDINLHFGRCSSVSEVIEGFPWLSGLASRQEHIGFTNRFNKRFKI